jgi:hypothetical protein
VKVWVNCVSGKEVSNAVGNVRERGPVVKIVVIIILLNVYYYTQYF